MVMSMLIVNRTIPLRLHISYLFIGLLLLFAVVSNFYYYHGMTNMMSDAADREMILIGKQASTQIDNLYQSSASFVDLLAQQQWIDADTLPKRLKSLPFLITGMQHQPSLEACYIGYINGDFFLLRRWQKGMAWRFTAPPETTAWVVQSVTHAAGQMHSVFLYFNANQQLLRQDVPSDYHYDPRSRPWYQASAKQTTMVTSLPYIFFTTRQNGITLSRQTENKMAVVGADIKLAMLSQVLQQARITTRTQLALVDQHAAVWSLGQGEAKIISMPNGKLRPQTLNELKIPALATLYRKEDKKNGTSLLFQAGHENWQGMIRTLPVPGAKPLILLIAVPHRELLANAILTRNNAILVSGLILLIGMLLAIWLARMASNPLKRLALEASKIQRFDFSDSEKINSYITEVHGLATSITSMKTTIRQFLELSTTLASETNFQQLLKCLLSELQEVTHASGGIIYLYNSDKLALQPAQAQWDGNFLPASDSLGDVAYPASSAHPMQLVLQQPDNTVEIDAALMQQWFPSLGSVSSKMTLLALPLNDRKGLLLGVLLLFVDEQRQPLNAELKGFARALSGTAAVALHTQSLIEEQKNLLEAFIQLLAGAIDAKSRYTGGHCQRVPEITRLLAEAACNEKEGVFANFVLNDEEWEELRIAAWLHDCGKITTPEYVVDKATKLETLYDRLHEIRMRFEVLKRDAELACWKEIAAGEAATTRLAALSAELAQLNDDYLFVASCNEGGEFMSADKMSRLQQIAQRRWQRTLSDRVGIAFSERQRKEEQGAEVLPVWEQLLADKPEHIIERSEYEMQGNDSSLGFRVTIPQALYNRGEIYNLSISRGTLTEEERYKINEHIIQSIIMLSNLPLPSHLRRIPEIAGGHHEKMNGTGYPRRLKRDEMSWVARMMAIADIFEALTAADRPYKKGKKLSEAIKIMRLMVKEQHIDPDLFDLFMRSGVYLNYAHRYLAAEQMDEVNFPDDGKVD